MKIVRVPQATAGQPQLVSGEISFVDYSDSSGAFRNRVLFDRYAFSFVQQGEKQIFQGTGHTVLRPGNGMLIPEGNSIIIEHNGHATFYHSLVIFFPGQLGRHFMASRNLQRVAEPVDAPFIHFQTNAYLQEYVRNIRSLIAEGQLLSEEVAALKIRELLTVVYEMYPSLVAAMFKPTGGASLKAVVESNLLNPLSLEELSFLSNRSLSSFKRDFQKAYGVSPQRYIREKRLEMARVDLENGKLSSEIFLNYGYQHLANFIAAFKRQFGTTPADCSGGGLDFSQ